jgi:hypothetical protein
MFRSGNFLLLERREYKRSEMHPLPEQTSRIFNCGAGGL